MKRYLQCVSWSGIIVLLLSLLPFVALCGYSHPYYDDFGFALQTHEAWNETHSLSAVFAAALQHAKEIRSTWQGTYTGTFLSNLQPGLFSENYYPYGSLFLLIFFIGSFLMLFAALGMTIGLPRFAACGAASWLVAYLLWFMPSVAEGFFWFNGGIGNTFIYSVIALAIVLAIALCRSQSPLKRGVIRLGLLVSTVILGGGSYTGGILCLLLGLGTAVYLFSKHSKRAYSVLILYIVFVACFLYSVCAPGNHVRAGMIGASESAVMSILKAVYYGTALIGSYTTLPLIAITFLLLPLLLMYAKKNVVRCKHPLFVCLACYLLFCAQITPTLYSGVFLGADRTVNTYFFSFVVLWFVCVYALISAAVNRWAIGDKLSFSVKNTGAFFLAFAVLFGVGAMGTCKNGSYGIHQLNSVSAYIALLDGSAVNYHRSMKARSDALNAENQSVVVLSSIDGIPNCFMPDSLFEAEGDSIITTLRQYYHKEQILREGENTANE